MFLQTTTCYVKDLNCQYCNFYLQLKGPSGLGITTCHKWRQRLENFWGFTWSRLTTGQRTRSCFDLWIFFRVKSRCAKAGHLVLVTSRAHEELTQVFYDWGALVDVGSSFCDSQIDSTTTATQLNLDKRIRRFDLSLKVAGSRTGIVGAVQATKRPQPFTRHPREAK